MRITKVKNVDQFGVMLQLPNPVLLFSDLRESQFKRKLMTWINPGIYSIRPSRGVSEKN